MSGDSLVLAAETDSVLFRAVERLAELAPGLPEFALIGGLAVIARLGQAHRATNDVDAVSDDQPGLLEALRAGGLDRRGDSILLDADLKLDVIDVSEGDPDYLPYLTHRLAFDTRTPLEIVVQSRRGGRSAAATVDVARAPALVAIKLGISEGVGRARAPGKVGGDAFDVARLMQRFGPDVLADGLASIHRAYSRSTELYLQGWYGPGHAGRVPPSQPANPGDTSVSPVGLASRLSSAVKAPMMAGASKARLRRPTLT